MARRFASATDYVTFTGLINVGNIVSFSAWVYPLSTTGGGQVFGGFNGGWSWYGGYGGAVMSFVKHGIVGIGNSNTPLVLNAWNHVGVTYNGTIATFYFGTSPDGSGSNAQTESPASSYYRISVDDYSNYLHGCCIYDLGVWSTVLTAGEMAALGSGVRPWMLQRSMKAYWLSDGLRTTEPDLSGNNWNGVVTGAKSFIPDPPLLMTTFVPRWTNDLYRYVPIDKMPMSMPMSALPARPYWPGSSKFRLRVQVENRETFK